VQTPTLALIVNRQKEIDNFKPEPYWVLATVYRDTTFTATSGKFTSKEEGEKAFATIEGKPFTVTKVEKKQGKETPPSLYDLTSLQVDCNRKYGFSAETTLNIIQQLYEQKLTTYPRVDTTFLPDDVYGKCPQTMNGLFQVKYSGQSVYADLVKPLGGKPLLKSKKVFDSSKVTDHHAIIPTGIVPQNLTDLQRKVYDLIARRFIAVFYPDCKFAQTTVLGEVRSAATESQPTEQTVEFKVTGRTILNPGWRAVYAKDTPVEEDTTPAEGQGEVQERTLPVFVKDESGPHTPTLTEKWTTPPKYYTEATLLRAMETAGKLVDDEELRAAMKENGIGRPSTRAAIIETLFKRHYIRKERKNLMATPTGTELIDLIREELLKSAELTGIWEKKLRDIEAKKYDPQQFIDELKQQVTDIVREVIGDASNRRVPVEAVAPSSAPAKGEEKPKKKRAPKKKPSESTPTADPLVGQPCPICGQGTIIKGKTAYGCSRWKEGCTFRQPFEQ
jgi:DNA topoisomerase-3